MTTLRSLGAIFCLTLAAMTIPTLAAEASAQQQSATAERTDRSRLQAAEIEASPTVERDLYEVVRSLRPHWMRTRGDRSVTNNGRLQVYVNGMQAGGVEELRRLDPRSVKSMQFLDASSATMQFGSDHARGAILVTLR